MPEGANLGLGCGNPQAIAALKPGETVLDLGSGAGFDAFLAARQVGADGARHRRRHDPRHDLQGARQRGQGRLRQRRVPPRRDRAPAGGRRHGRRHHLQLRHQPVAGQGPGVPRRLPRAEARRPPGHLRHRHHRPAAARRCSRKSPSTPACVAGAASVDELTAMLAEAGFADIRIAPKDASREFIRHWAPGRGVEDFIASASIEAVKPQPEGERT